VKPIAARTKKLDDLFRAGLRAARDDDTDRVGVDELARCIRDKP
jgi:hypothetical protein